MKKLFYMALSLVAIAAFTACGSDDDDEDVVTEPERLDSVVCKTDEKKPLADYSDFDWEKSIYTYDQNGLCTQEDVWRFEIIEKHNGWHFYLKDVYTYDANARIVSVETKYPDLGNKEYMTQYTYDGNKKITRERSDGTIPKKRWVSYLDEQGRDTLFLEYDYEMWNDKEYSWVVAESYKHTYDKNGNIEKVEGFSYEDGKIVLSCIYKDFVYDPKVQAKNLWMPTSATTNWILDLKANKNKLLSCKFVYLDEDGKVEHSYTHTFHYSKIKK